MSIIVLNVVKSDANFLRNFNAIFFIEIRLARPMSQSVIGKSWYDVKVSVLDNLPR